MAVASDLTLCFAELRETFDMFDENKDGTIDIKELKNMMGQFNQKVSDEELNSIMKTADIDGRLEDLTQHKKASNHHANHTPGNVQFYIVTTWETPGNHWC